MYVCRYFAYLASSIGLHYHLLMTTKGVEKQSSPSSSSSSFDLEVDLIEMTTLVTRILVTHSSLPRSLNSTTLVGTQHPDEDASDQEDQE